MQILSLLLQIVWVTNLRYCLQLAGDSQSGVPFLALTKFLISSGSRLHGWSARKSYIWLAIWISSKVFNFHFELSNLFFFNIIIDYGVTCMWQIIKLVAFWFISLNRTCFSLSLSMLKIRMLKPFLRFVKFWCLRSLFSIDLYTLMLPFYIFLVLW